MSRARRASSSRQAPGAVWWAVIIVSSVIGGLAAAALSGVSVLGALTVSILIGAAVALVVQFGFPGTAQRAVVIEQAGGDRQSRPSDRVGQPGGEDGSALVPPATDPDPAGKRGSDGVVRVIDLPPPAAPGPSWWEKTGSVAEIPAETRAAAPLSSYLNSVIIAQCPRCGSFAIDAIEGPTEWAFRCHACRHTWTWRPGASWPAIEVRPRLRGGGRPPQP